MREKLEVSTHSRTKAAAALAGVDKATGEVSTHSRTKAAAAKKDLDFLRLLVSTHSRTKAAALNTRYSITYCYGFQHTAARRRLQIFGNKWYSADGVSTHSRAEAAAVCIV